MISHVSSFGAVFGNYIRDLFGKFLQSGLYTTLNQIPLLVSIAYGAASYRPTLHTHTLSVDIRLELRSHKRDDACEHLVPGFRVVPSELEQPVHHLVEVLHAVGDLLEELPLRWKCIQLYVLELDLEHLIEGCELGVAPRSLKNHLVFLEKLDFVKLGYLVMVPNAQGSPC